MASPVTPTARPLGSTVFRSPDGEREVILRTDGIVLQRKAGTRPWRIRGTWDTASPATLKALRSRNYTEHRIDEEGDVIR